MLGKGQIYLAFPSLNRTFASGKSKNKKKYGNQESVSSTVAGHQGSEVTTQRPVYMGFWMEVANIYGQS
jgi:subtilase family serine protease